jgi:hypothetical protein
VPAIEGYGVEPIPEELRTVGWRDLFAITYLALEPIQQTPLARSGRDQATAEAA